jgi:hypothetical protein
MEERVKHLRVLLLMTSLSAAFGLVGTIEQGGELHNCALREAEIEHEWNLTTNIPVLVSERLQQLSDHVDLGKVQLYWMSLVRQPVSTNSRSVWITSTEVRNGL